MYWWYNCIIMRKLDLLEQTWSFYSILESTFGHIQYGLILKYIFSSYFHLHVYEDDSRFEVTNPLTIYKLWIKKTWYSLQSHLIRLKNFLRLFLRCDLRSWFRPNINENKSESEICRGPHYVIGKNYTLYMLAVTANIPWGTMLGRDCGSGAHMSRIKFSTAGGHTPSRCWPNMHGVK